jgi:GH15 family glucan-1,4-alpha-glucosidase
MLTRVRKYGLTILLPCLISTLGHAQASDSKAPWKGYAILGNGHLTAVYSDDSRISALTHGEGIQHFYFKDYTADYVASTNFLLLKQDGNPLEPAAAGAVAMKNFFTTQTQTPFSNVISQTVLCFVHPEDAVVLSLSEHGPGFNGRFQFRALLRKEIKTDQAITLTSFQAFNNVAVAQWSNGTVLAIAPKSAGDKITVKDATVSITGRLSSEQPRAEVLLVPASSRDESVSKVRLLRQEKDLEITATHYWNSWMNAGRLPVFKSNEAQAAEYLEVYKRNLYCVKSANLNGQIPADITGQFVTNGMPQLYPRDAMMCARVLLLTGHTEEARQVIEFWTRPVVPMKTPGEWYARYDAHGHAVDAGSGARFDEPEWDANGYYIYLLNEYHRTKGVWLADARIFYEVADFLVEHISPNGLLQEGGIVEWTGYLPATNMICAAALTTAGSIARELGNGKRADVYAAAAQKISAALPKMFDGTRQTYGDVRYTGVKGANGESLAVQSGRKLYLWDTTANVGVIWGYPNHREIGLSNIFYAKNTVKLGGGMQYFDSPDPGLASYGHGVFFFTTAAAAQYESLYGRSSTAKSFIDWMMRNANSYGLMPEHILPDGSDCSPASPLSWCSAEFAAALLLWSQS